MLSQKIEDKLKTLPPKLQLETKVFLVRGETMVKKYSFEIMKVIVTNEMILNREGAKISDDLLMAITKFTFQKGYEAGKKEK